MSAAPPFASVAGKQVVSAKDPKKPDFQLLSTTGKPLVARGEAADSKDWPATLLASSVGCTATLVGPRAVLTAAHCVVDGGAYTVFIRNIDNTMDCTHAKEYSPDVAQWDRTSADYAMCVLRISVAGKGIRFENVGAGPLVTSGDTVRLLGYGCDGATTTSTGFGVLRTGLTAVESTPPATSANNYIVTDWSKGAFGHAKGAALCPGDSGGAAYWPSPLNDSVKVRRIIGVNSRTGVEAGGGNVLNGKSFLSSLLTPTALTFLNIWKDKGIEICGVTPGMAECRN